MINDISSDENEELKKNKYVKKTIPKALREQVWINTIGKKFSSKCTISWCTNTITPFDYHCAHIIPESKNGSTTIENLVPTCSKCNLSMSNNYTVVEWNDIITLKTGFFSRLSNKLSIIFKVLFH